MLQTLIDFEKYVGLPPAQACRLLGIAYVTYAHYRSEFRALPGYHSRHIRTIYMLSDTQLTTLKSEVADGE